MYGTVRRRARYEQDVYLQIIALRREFQMKNLSKWIWYYGDFEIYHSLKLHTRRDEYDYIFPPFWRLDDCWHNVKFKKDVNLAESENITVTVKGSGFVEVDGVRHSFGRPVCISKGEHTIIVYVINMNGLPSIYVEGSSIKSDESWLVSNYSGGWINAGGNDSYICKTDDTQIFKFCYKEIKPVSQKNLNGGVLYDFGRETFAKLCFEKVSKEIDVFYGESEQEAVDIENAYLKARVYPEDSQELPCRAFRYLYIANASDGDCSLKAYYEYLPLKERGRFKCSDELINKIWDTSVYTLHLNSREFFLDGIKRDRWVWSGDAYQSYLVNRYIFFNTDICKRTILALRGRDPVEKHINTILDYSFYWIISIYDYYEMSGDRDFIKRIYPKMVSLMDFCMSRRDKNGFAAKVDDDWIFIDWADMDKTGAVCAEQMLFLRSLEAMSHCCGILNISDDKYKKSAYELKKKINEYFWNEEKGAFIDSFESGKDNVTRHANIFALLFGYADEKQRGKIIKNVLLNENIPQIKTPYFKFYELEAMCSIGGAEAAAERIRSYWGGMLDLGATSFWEEYSPEQIGDERFGMYGDKFGKSLCHAWGASPIYLIGKYFMGVTLLSPGYETFEVKPDLGGLEWFEGSVPVNEGSVSVSIKDGMLEVLTDKDGGVLVWRDKRYYLEKNVLKRLEINA